MEKRSVMSHYRSRKISGTQQSFLTEMAICIAERWKKVWVTILFLNAIMHRKVIHVNFFCFFLSYWQDHSLLRSRKFATMAT